MENYLILLTSYQILLALIFGLLTVYIVLKITNNFILKIDSLESIREGNTAIAIFKGSLTIAVLIMVENSILPAVDALKTMIYAYNGIEVKMFLISFGYFLLFYTISLIFSFLLIFTSFFIYIRATKNVDEMEEIRKNNLAVSLMLSMVIIGMMLFVRPSFNNFVASFVNHTALIQSNSSEGNTSSDNGGGTPQKTISPK